MMQNYYHQTYTAHNQTTHNNFKTKVLYQSGSDLDRMCSPCIAWTCNCRASMVVKLSFVQQMQASFGVGKGNGRDGDLARGESPSIRPPSSPLLIGPGGEPLVSTLCCVTIWPQKPQYLYSVREKFIMINRNQIY